MSGSVRILVIDDESIRDVTHAALADAGYDVVEWRPPMEPRRWTSLARRGPT
jgi:DNA-binding NtrC family response regulator